ncbi:MAG: hypothetical protein KBS85_07980, partial [Lachnospiraceae bacterium]|nr:hypothetical protein [Candidatus Merdinaster equi]
MKMKEKNMTKSFIMAIMTIMVVFSMVQFSSFDSAAKSKKQQAVLTTTMECSVWSKPSTEEKYRVKKIPAGYQVTVYTTPVDSIKGDGKKYYQTVKGSYILCKCFEGEVTPGTGTVTQPVVTGYTPIQMLESASVTVSSEADVKRIYKEA